jgi:hypothetical protein
VKSIGSRPCDAKSGHVWPAKAGPSLILDKTDHAATPDLFYRVVGVLDDMEFVIDDTASRNPLLDTQPKRFPHVHAARFDASALSASQLRSEELVQRLLLPFLAKPQGLAGLQIAHYRKKFVVLPPVNLIHTHLPESWLAPRCRHRSR